VRRWAEVSLPDDRPSMVDSAAMNVDTYGVELWGCRGPLNDADALEAALRAASDRVGATVMTSTRAVYQPHGVTVVLVLAESHMVISTWPEHDYALVDLLLCNADMAPEAAAEEIIRALEPTRTRPWRVTHDIGPEPPP